MSVYRGCCAGRPSPDSLGHLGSVNEATVSALRVCGDSYFQVRRICRKRDPSMLSACVMHLKCEMWEVTCRRVTGAAPSSAQQLAVEAGEELPSHHRTVTKPEFKVDGAVAKREVREVKLEGRVKIEATEATV